MPSTPLTEMCEIDVKRKGPYMLMFCLMDGNRDDDKSQRSATDGLFILEISAQLETSISLICFFGEVVGPPS